MARRSINPNACALLRSSHPPSACFARLGDRSRRPERRGQSPPGIRSEAAGSDEPACFTKGAPIGERSGSERAKIANVGEGDPPQARRPGAFDNHRNSP